MRTCMCVHTCAYVCVYTCVCVYVCVCVFVCRLGGHTVYYVCVGACQNCSCVLPQVLSVYSQIYMLYLLEGGFHPGISDRELQ